MIDSKKPIVPKDPNGELLVLFIGRISTEYQNLENIDASYRYNQEFLSRLYQGPMDIRYLGEQASGMRTDRKTIREAEDLISTGKVDLVIAEDLARIYRNPRHQYNFVQDAVDAGTRVICIGDNLDTADENWELMLSTASMRHGMFIPETRRRVRRTATHTFHNGGMVMAVKFGYRKLSKEEADTGLHGPKGLRLAKVPEWTPIIREMRERAMKSPNFEAIADWLNAERIPVGPKVRRKRWSGRLVAELLRDPILSGTRQFRQLLYKPIFETGKHKRERNGEPEIEDCPELAHMTREEQEQMWAVIGGPSGWNGKSAAKSPREGIPRSRTLWPGQSATCGICGGDMWLMGELLKCENSLKRRGKSCWNHVLVSIPIVRERMIAFLLGMFAERPDCQAAFLDATWKSYQSQRQHLDVDAEMLRKELASLKRQADNLGKAIADGGHLKTLVDQLGITEEQIRSLRAELNKVTSDEAEGFATYEQVVANAERALQMEMSQSHEFTDVMRRFFPKFEIWPVQALDSGLVRPRGKLHFKNSASNGSEDHPIVMDLFDPPAHIAVLRQCQQVKAENPKLGCRKLGKRIDAGYMTVKRAFAYARLMEAEGRTDFYRELREKPDNASRWR